MLKNLLLFVILLITGCLNSQTLYWVGGSGYWNDMTHWSYTSGGKPANRLPSVNSDVIFDNESANQNFTIHALHSFGFKSITATNNAFKAEIIGSPNVDLTVKGNVNLNPYFKFKLNGKVNLVPETTVKYEFSHNEFNNDVFINASGNVELGVLKTQKTLFISGNLNLNKSFIYANDLKISNSKLYLQDNLIQVYNTVTLDAVTISTAVQAKSKIICKKSDLTPQTLNILQNDNGLVVAQILSPAACTVTKLTETNPTCSGVCDGTVAFNLSGCADPNFDIQWINSVGCLTPPAESSYSSNTYSVGTLCGCSQQYQVIFINPELPGPGGQLAISVAMTDPPATTLFFIPTRPTCNGLTNGRIIASVISGATPLSMTWTPGSTVHNNIISTDTLKNVGAGTYSLTVENNNGCVNTFTTSVTQPSVLVANGSKTNLSCNLVCSGSATVAPTGGTSPYTYVWSPSTSATGTISALCAGVVSVTVTDSKTCTATYSTTITQPPAITLTIAKTDLVCGSVCNGSASVTATGGTGAFTYSWSPSGGTAAVASGLCAGNYTVTVTNNSVCVQTKTVTITSPPTLTATPTQTNLTCNAVCNGSININPSGGTGAYTYSWSPGTSTTAINSNVCAGVYTYTLTDALACKYTNSVTITQPSATTLTVSKTNILCFGACNGTATGIMTGGTSPYTYTWSPGNPTGQGTTSITALCAGVYTVTSRDANTCSKTQTISVTEPAAITTVTSSAAPGCSGACTGSINSTASNGTAPYTYSLQSSAAAPVTTSPPYTNLCAASYTLTTTDAAGCKKIQTFNLAPPSAVVLSLGTSSISCFNQCNATISSTVSGGTPGYTFVWSDGTTGTSITNKCAGVYTATVTDISGCKATKSATITAPTDLTVTITPTNPNCNGQCTGVVTTTVTGGTPNYTINLSNGSSGNIISNLCQGNYTVTVTDFAACVKTKTVAITSPPAMTLTPTNGSVSCSGSSNGTVAVLATGGTSGYSYSWNSTPTQTTATASNLPVGSYVSTVTDALGCIASTTANVTQPSVLTATIGNIVPSCNICIGAATAQGIGGTAPYTYSWQPGGQTTQTASNLCVGIQTVIVRDNSGCTTTQTVQISPTVIVITTPATSTLACNNVCSGIAAASASGGLAPYSYTWSPAPTQNTSTATNLCAGTHTVQVTDANGCSNSKTVTFINPPAVTVTVNQTNVTCSGLANGSATVNASGGTGSLSYLWQPGNYTTTVVSGLTPGIYSVSITDASSCSQTQTVSITETNSITAAFSYTNPTTCILSDGSINATVSGGTPTYTIAWQPGGATTNLISNVPAGSYSLSIRDAAGCTQTVIASLGNPSGPTVTVNSTSISCYGNATGSATLSITGSGPFSVNWPTIPSTNTVVANLASGVYFPQVTDVNGCIATQSVNIAEPAQFLSPGVSSNVTCNSACTGSINLSPTGGTTPYAYSWSPSGGSGQDPTNLCIGNYSVTVTDANSCVVNNTFVITQPTALSLSFNKKDVACNGTSTGAVRAVVSGGTSPYTYSWTPKAPFVGSILDTIVNLSAGVYSVSVTDFNGCIITGTINIDQPTALTSTISKINAKCANQCNGSATINYAGGTGPYVFSFNTTPATTTQSVSGLCLGLYTGKVTDANGCISSNNFLIAEPAPIVVTATVSNPKCNATCDGSVATTVTGGNSSNYTYNWVPAGGPVANPTGLCEDIYFVTVKDDSLCSGSALVTLVDPSVLIANTSFTNPTCNLGCNGIVSATPQGGTAPFTYAWLNPLNASQTVSSLCAGDYTVTVTDANLCSDTQTLTLVDPTAISLNPAVTLPQCGVNDGVINAVAVSGVAPYTYNWLPPVSLAQNTNTIVTGLGAGVYTVIVTDANLCSATISVPLSNSNGPTDATITSTMVTCNGLSNGSAEVSNPIGGTPSYTLSWISPVSASATVSGLSAGTYTAQVVDANNCLYFEPITITEPQAIDDNENMISANCFGNCNGSITLNPSGGNGGYTYLWSNSVITNTVSNLCPGAISVTITDNQSCTLSTTYTVGSITTITSSTFATNNNCYGDCNGTILATNVAGGLPPYTYNWSDPLGQSASTALGLCNGNYSVTITDANGCFNAIPANVTSPAQVTFTPTITDPTCGSANGSAVINPTGGTPAYTYTWSNNQTGNTATNLASGVYAVQIKDGNNCISNSNIIINNSTGITGETVSYTDVSCGGTCDGTATVTAVGGTGAITYHWVHNGSASQSLSGLCAGTYFCNMTDATGCTRTASVSINATTVFTITPQISQSDCISSTGFINVSVTGGSGVYTYAWSNAANTASITNLAPGNYTLTVSDGVCSQTQIYPVNTTNGPILTISKTDITCGALCDGTAALTISGGTPTYTTAWSTGSAAASINALCSGPYSVTVIDAAGCLGVQNFSIGSVSPLVFSTPNIVTPLCNNNCNGVITSLPIGGVLPYTYSWSTSTSTTSIANNMCSGNYSLTVSDANGCSAVEEYTLTGPTSITVTAIVTDAKCNAALDGAIELTVSGGTPGPGYTYSWSPSGATTASVSGLAAGIYSVSVFDNNACEVVNTYTINEPAAMVDGAIITPAACFGNCNGSIELNPTGGVGAYTYSWSTSATTGTVTSMCAGPHTATVTDGQGCNLVTNYTVPSLLTITSTTIATDNICFTDCKGVLTATNVVGGVGPYTFQWNDPLGQVGNTAINLCTGSYSVTITDANGCYSPVPAVVGAPSQVTFTSSVVQPSCNRCDGTATITPIGGTPGYTYLWSNNQTSDIVSSLCAGVYVVQITDGNACVSTTSITIDNSSTITGETVIATDVTCAGSCDGTINLTAVGGVAPISYNWLHNHSSSQTLSGLCPGTYFCNMIDANGCSRTASVVIGSATTLTISSQVTQSSCTASTGSITVNVSGGSGVYAYAWLPAGNTATISNLAPGSYTLTVNDGTCSQTQIYALNSINAPVLTNTHKDVSCIGMCDGAIDLTVTGGTPTYTTTWSTGATTSSVSALCAGNYSVIVTDAAGCAAVQNMLIETIAPIIFNAPGLVNPSCHNYCDGALTVLPLGGTLPYTFTWTPSNVNTVTSNSLCSGNYSVNVSDVNGCPASDSYSLSNPSPMTAVVTTTAGSCSTAFDGFADLTPVGGAPAYTYSWTPGAYTSEDLTNVLPGDYTVTISDNSGCLLDTTLSIGSTLTVTAIAGNDTLFCQNGVLQLNGSNSIGGVTYDWTDLTTNAVIASTLVTQVSPAIGTNTFVLTATNGVCIDKDTIVVTTNALPIVDAGPSSKIPTYTTLSIGGSPTAPGGGTISWLPIDGLDSPTSANPTTGTTVTTIYTVTVLDANGCSNWDSVTVLVYPDIIITSGFSPNGDGKNDEWKIDILSQFVDAEVEIYNRWGDRLFYSKGYAVPFNGKYNGKDLPVGTYYYVINLNSSLYPNPFTGPLTIFR